MARILKRMANKPVVLIVLAMLLVVCVTRAVSIAHEMTLHPDEPHFFRSSVSLTNKLLNFDETYKVSKVYPEGAFVLQVPFHLLERLVCNLTGLAENPRLWGRIASVFYYLLGCLTGAMVLYRYFGKRPAMVGVFGLIMVFGLFHIEQSRYGTGDAMTLFLLMGAIFAAALFLEKRSGWFLALSGCFVGAMGAVKYPQLFFIVLPIGALAISGRRGRWRKAGLAAGLLMATVVAFFALSPSAVVNPAYITQAITRELSAYTAYGNGAEAGSPLEHLLSLLVYQLFYADMPLSLPIVVYAAVSLIAKAKGQRNAVDWFFAAIVPAAMFVFFSYNLFVTSMFMRTYYPYFCLCALYTAWGVCRLMQHKGMRVALCALLSVMVIRGVFFVGVLSQPSRADTVLKTLTQHEGWNTRTDTVLLGGVYHTGDVDIPQPRTTYDFSSLYMEDLPTLEPGQFAMTMPMDYCFAEPYLLPIANERVLALIDKWQAFKAENEPYYIGQPYPDWYYGLFGYWVHGTTGTLFEFPTNYLYHRPVTP